MLLILPHKHYPFLWIVTNTRLPQLALFSCLEFDCPAEDVVKTHTGKPPHSDRINTSLIYLPSPRPILFLVYGIIYQCPIDRIRVASNSDIDTNRLLSAILNLFWSKDLTVVWTVWKSLDLRRIEPTLIFSPGFYTFSSGFLSGNTGVPYKEIFSKDYKIESVILFLSIIL